MLQQAVHNKRVAQQYRDAKGRFARKPEYDINFAKQAFPPKRRVQFKVDPVPAPTSMSAPVYKTDQEEERIKQEEIARNFLRDINRPQVCAFTMWGPNHNHKTSNGACHYSFKEDKDIGSGYKEFVTYKVVSSAIGDDTEEEKAYNDYLFSSDSLWSAISTTCEVVKKGDSRVGFLIPHETLKKYPQSFLYNFLIGSRISLEGTQYLKTWVELQKLGLNPTEALLLCRLTYFSGSRWSEGGYHIRGWHWPFDHKITDLRRILNKDPNLNSLKEFGGSWSTGTWGTRGYGNSGLPCSLLDEFKGTITETKFSKVQSVDLQKIVDHYVAIREKVMA